MNTSLPLFRATAALLLACATSACGSAPAPTPASGTGSADLLRQIQVQTADLSCDGPQQCHTLAVGAKACGGPERYLPWSSKQQDGAALRELAAHHAALRRAEDTKSGMLSNCMAVQDPGANCVAGRCVLRPAGIAQPYAQ
jgi:hypothetical protein